MPPFDPASPNDARGVRSLRIEAVLCCLVLGIAIASAWIARPHGLMLLDEGYLLQPVERMTEGELLYRDVFAHYGPLRFHVLALAFEWFGPSILVARTVLIGVVLAAVASTFFVAVRLAPPALAAIPAAIVALAPGPWTKSFFGLTIALNLLVLARALERPTLLRFAAMGVTAGFGVLTRQDVGLVCLAAAVTAACLSPFATQPRQRPLARGVAAGSVVLAASALVVGAAAAWYAANGGLAALADLTLVRSFTQRSAYGFGLWRLLEAGGLAPEGRLAGSILLIPALVSIVALPVWISRTLRAGIDHQTILTGALLVIAVAALSNAYYQPYVLRFLQSAIPFYLLLIWLAASAARAARHRLGSRSGAVAANAILGLAAASAAVLVWSVLAGIPRPHLGPEYTGSIRSRELTVPVEVMGDTLYVEWETAESIRLLRAFAAEHVAPGEPIVVLPLEAMYWQILGRPNPLWISISDWVAGDFLLTESEKTDQVQRMREAGVRFAFVAPLWLFQEAAPDALRRELLEEFVPIRSYRGTLVLQRGTYPGGHDLSGILARGQAGTATAADLEAAIAIAEANPTIPLPRFAAGVLAVAFGRLDLALASFAEAARLDPSNPDPLELRADALLRAGRASEAAGDLRTALSVRASPTAAGLIRRLPPSLRPATPAD